MRQKQNWQIKTEDGRTVKIKYTSRYFSKDSICHHLEFRGYAVSETSYRSHFFGHVGEGAKDMSVKKAKNLAKKLIKEWLLPPQQIGLI